MIVSHQHGFIFLKTKKTGGTSIELALSKLCGPDDIITPLTPEDEKLREGRGPQHWRRHGWLGSKRPLWRRRWLRFSAADYGFYNHMPAAEARALIGDDDIWRRYFKFAIERNPWDRQVSFYHYRHRRDRQPPPFAESFKDRHARLNNFDIYSLDGTPAADFIVRYEHLKDDLQNALKQIGIDQPLVLPHAKASFRGEKKPYQDYYDDRTRETVADWYAREIALLGYRF